MSDLDLRMYILVNSDVRIKKGKLAGQVGHAVAVYFWRMFSGGLFLNEEIEKIYITNKYMNTMQKKIILYAPEKKLKELESQGEITIRDKGITQLEPNTIT